MTTVALIDDHESVRLGLHAVLVDDGASIVFSGSTVGEYRRSLRDANAVPADIVLLDLTLGDGTTVAENVSSLAGESAVIVHSVADRPASVREALATGAVGVVSKASPLEEVVQAVRTVAAGEPLDNVEWASAVESDTDFADPRARGAPALRRGAAAESGRRPARHRLLDGEGEHRADPWQIRRGRAARAHQGRSSSACDRGRHHVVSGHASCLTA